jgi:hypothetical protein
LSLKLRVMCRRDRDRAARRRGREEGLAAALFGKVAFEGARPDGEGDKHVSVGHAASDGGEDSLTQVKGISAHCSSISHDHYLCSPL